MPRQHPFIIAIALAALTLTACGDDEPTNDFGVPSVSKLEAYRSNVGAQCIDAKEAQQQLRTPELGSSAALAVYLGKTVTIAEGLSRRLREIKPPPELATGMARAVKTEEELGQVLSSYERAARGGREFELTLSQLEPEVNRQIREVNRAFGQVEIPACQGEELDLGFAGR